MKKGILVISAIFFMSTGLMAQKMNALKTDLFSPFIRTGTLKYERAVTEDISVQLGFFYTGFRPFDSNSKFSGYGITPEFRFYLSDTPAPHGTYLAPNVRYYNFTVSDADVDGEGTFSNISLAINLGKQVMLKDIVVIDAWVGPSYNFRSFETSNSEINVGINEVNGFGLRIGLAIGIAF